MKVKEIAEKFSIDKDQFYHFLQRNTKTLQFKNTAFSADVPNEKVESYVELFKQEKEDQSKAHQQERADLNQKSNNANSIYSCKGARGRHLDVYPNKVVISVEATAGSLLTGNVTDGEKTIYFSDCIGIQYKKCGMTLGYLQFETAGSMMNKKRSNFFNENTFTWDTKSISNGLTESQMAEVADYCKRCIDEIKSQKTQPVIASSNDTVYSVANEIREFKKLLDDGIISQEEFDAKKKQLLNL